MSAAKTEMTILKKNCHTAHQFWRGDMEDDQEPGLLSALKIS